MAIEIDPLTKQLKTEGGLENLLNPQVSATQVSEPAKEVGILGTPEVRTQTISNENWWTEQERIKKEIADKTYQAQQLQSQLTEQQKREAKDITLYKGTESILASTLNQEDYLAKGWSITPTDEFLGGEKDETPVVKTPEQKLIEEEQAKATQMAADVKSVNDELELAKANSDAITQSIIIGLQDSKNAQLALQQDLNERSRKITETMGIRFGTARYAPQLAGDIITAQERAGLRELATIRAKYDELIVQAKQAKNDKDYERLNEKRKEINDAKKAQDAAILELKKEQLKKTTELQTKLVQASRDSTIADLISQGITDPGKILNLLNFDENGNMIGDVTNEEVDKVLDTYVSSQTKLNSTEEKIDSYTNENNERVVAFYDSATGNVREVVMGKVKSTSGIGAGVLLPGATITSDQLSPLAKAVYDGLYKLSDLTPTQKGQIAGELLAVGYTSAVSSEMKQDVSLIKNQLDIIFDNWKAIPDEYKGQIQGRFGSLTKAQERIPAIATFLASNNIIGMQLTRLYEKGRISDQDRIFYLSLMPNVNQNQKAAEASVAELKRILDEKLKSQVNEAVELKNIAKKTGNVVGLKQQVEGLGYNYDQMIADGLTDERIKEELNL